MGEVISSDEQLRRWVGGESVHNDQRDECCPDFSCCVPELKADAETRKAFADAPEDRRIEYLGMFLGAAIARHTDKNVHVAGFGGEGQEN